ncbi:hypothetical protein [Streptomyces sp. NPDC056061]
MLDRGPSSIQDLAPSEHTDGEIAEIITAEAAEAFGMLEPAPAHYAIA